MDVGGEVVLSSAVYTLTRCPCSIKQPFPHAHARNPHEAQRATYQMKTGKLEQGFLRIFQWERMGNQRGEWGCVKMAKIPHLNV